MSQQYYQVVSSNFDDYKLYGNIEIVSVAGDDGQIGVPQQVN